MTTFFTADTHFGHTGIIAQCGRPFSSVDEMDREMAARWNAVVRPGDTVWHLGDFAHQADERTTRRIFGSLAGDKHLIVGNHDGGRVRELPWASVSEFRELALEGERLVLFHYGLRVWPGQHRGAIHLYGHSHGRLPGYRNCVDAGVDEWGYRPVTLADLKVRLATQPEFDPEGELGGPALDDESGPQI
jgi:calcineurin-like phosphoesterase family protein